MTIAWERTKQSVMGKRVADIAVWVAAAATGLNGITIIAQVLVPRLPGVADLAITMPPVVYRWSRSLSAITGLLLIFIAFNLLRRKRRAWQLALFVACASLLLHWFPEQSWTGLLFPGANAALLLVFRSRFTVRHDPNSLNQALGFVLLGLVAAVLYGTLGFWFVQAREFGIEFRFVDAVRQSIRQFSQLGNSELVPRTPLAVWFLKSLNLFGAAAAALAAFSLFQPLKYRLRTLPRERRLMLDILGTNGGSSLDFFKLWTDKSYYFTADERAGIAYKVEQRTALALGDPVGPPESIEEALDGFLEFCNGNGWASAFHEALPEHIALYESRGLEPLKLGQVAIVDLKRFIDVTSGQRDFQRARRRLVKEGCEAIRHRPPHSPELMSDCEAVSREWLQLPGRRERTFTLGQWNHAYIAETPLFVVRRIGGPVLAFVNLIPSFKAGEATADLLRHRQEVPNGTMDFLFLELFTLLAAEGFRTFDLGLAPLSGLAEDPGASLEERTLHEIYERMGRFFAYKGLRNYKDKFEPHWQDRYLVYSGGPIGLLRTGLAIIRATEGKNVEF